jgi:hypothetical protein
MPQFHPILDSVHHGGANGSAVEADNSDDACRKAAASLLNVSLPEVDRMLAKHEIEVIAVIKGDPEFVPTKEIPLFPGF